MTRAALAAASGIASTLMLVSTDSFAASPHGWGGGDYVRMESAPATDLQSNPGFVHDADGNWWKRRRKAGATSHHSSARRAMAIGKPGRGQRTSRCQVGASIHLWE